MINLADKFLYIWTEDYENSEGEIDRPDFTGVEKNYTSEKKIPYYIFDDGSTIIAIVNGAGRIHWVGYDSVEQLEEKRDAV